MWPMSAAALLPQSTMLGTPSSRATSSAKLMSDVGSTHVTGGTPGTPPRSRATSSLSGAAHRWVVALHRPRS